MPPRKGRRARKQPVKRKQCAISGFMNLPTEILNMIASYLSPLDLLHLARSSKFLRRLLMTKSARNLWLGAIESVEGLPPCPSILSEPRYVALVFTDVCSSCGASWCTQMEECLLVRLCERCREEQLMKPHELPSSVHELVHSSTRVPELIHLPKGAIPMCSGVVVREEAMAIWGEYNKLFKDNGEEEVELEAWIKQREQIVDERREFAEELNEFWCALRDRHNKEREELITSRRNQIEERLLALGWEEDDFDMNPSGGERSRKWHEMVTRPEQPKPLTEQTWKVLYPTLRLLLEVNRQERLELVGPLLEAQRMKCLYRFLKVILCREPPLLKVKPRQPNSPVPQWFGQELVQYDVFPFLHDASVSPFPKSLGEGLSVMEFQQTLEEHRSDVDRCISEWRDKTRAHLADMIREGNLEYSELLQPPKNMDRDAYARLSDNQKLLLRADSLFYVDHGYGPGIPQRPRIYDDALSLVSESLYLWPKHVWDLRFHKLKAPPLDTLYAHTTAQQMAWHLLKDLNKPNVSFVEVNQRRYSCERCHDKEPKKWTEILKHYLDAKHNFTKIKNQASKLLQNGIIYMDVHIPGGKPMIRPCRPKVPVEVKAQKCRLCRGELISQDVVSSEPNIHQHLLEVHGVAEPKLDVHYFAPNTRKPYDYGEGCTKDDEELEADNEPGGGENSGWKFELELELELELDM
ncbi:unnamed protein product [Rhizoctonia solani]|nr:unnamed protein product [Rhizoctonia solani]